MASVFAMFANIHFLPKKNVDINNLLGHYSFNLLKQKNNMRKVTQQIKQAFEQGTSLKVGNTKTDGKTVWLHGNAIVKRDPDGLVRWSLAGWNSSTTRERVNGIANAGVRQVAFEPILNGQEIDSYDWFASNTKLPDLLVF